MYSALICAENAFYLGGVQEINLYNLKEFLPSPVKDNFLGNIRLPTMQLIGF